MNEIIAISSARRGQPVSYAVRHNGVLVPDAIQLTANAVNAFIDHVSGEHPGPGDDEIAAMLPIRLSVRLQDYDFGSQPAIKIDAGEMLRSLGKKAHVKWDETLDQETAYSETGSMLAAIQYVTKIDVGGDEREIRIRVPYTAFIDLKERVEDPWRTLKHGVSVALKRRLGSLHVPKEGEIVEFTTFEVLNRS